MTRLIIEETPGKKGFLTEKKGSESELLLSKKGGRDRRVTASFNDAFQAI